MRNQKKRLFRNVAVKIGRVRNGASWKPAANPLDSKVS